MVKAIKKSNAFNKKKMRDYIFIIIMLAWPLLHFLVFWVFVNGRTILLTFQMYDRYGTITGTPDSYYFTGLQNYIEVFKSFFFSVNNGGVKGLKIAFMNSLSIFPLNVFVILPIAFVCSFVLYKKIRLAGFFRVAFYIPSIISLVILIMLFRYMFSPDFGPVAQFLKLFGFTKDLMDTTTADSHIWTLIYIFCIWAGMGTNVILLSSAMSRIPLEVMESAKLDGVGFWRECFRIVMPLIWPTISTLIVFGCMGMFVFTQQPLLFNGENGETMTISLYVFTFARQGTKLSSSHAATVGILYCMLFTPLVFFIKWFTERFGKDAEF